MFPERLIERVVGREERQAGEKMAILGALLSGAREEIDASRHALQAPTPAPQPKLKALLAIFSAYATQLLLAAHMLHNRYLLRTSHRTSCGRWRSWQFAMPAPPSTNATRHTLSSICRHLVRPRARLSLRLRSLLHHRHVWLRA